MERGLEEEVIKKGPDSPGQVRAGGLMVAIYICPLLY